MRLRQLLLVGGVLSACNGIVGPLPPTPGDISVEQPSANTGSTPGALLSLVDNPAIRTIFPLPSDRNRADQVVNFEIQGFKAFNGDAANNISDVYNGDLILRLSGGDGTPASNGIVSFFGSANDNLVPWPNGNTDFFPPANADVFARGVRLGYKPLTADVIATRADGTTSVVSSGTVQLDPSVLLIPIEVVIATSPSFPNDTGLGTLTAQLSLWDQWQEVTNFVRASAPDNSITLSSRTLPLWRDPFQTPSWISGGELGVYSGVEGGYFTPDSVWRACGVQFRLRNFFTIQTDNVHNNVNTKGPFSTPNGPCADLKAIATADARHVSGIPIVIFVFREDFTGLENAVEIDNHTCGTNTLDATACVPILGSGPVLAHELGHMACLDDCDCVNDTNCHMMCSTSAVPPPSVGDCQSMRNYAGLFSKLWPR